MGHFFADRTDGFSGADIASICKSAAKAAIRNCIAQERAKFSAREAKRQEAEEKGEDYESEEEGEDDIVPYITKSMLMQSLSQANRSVTKSDLERYMKYKRDMERRIGMDNNGGGGGGGGGGSVAPPPTFSTGDGGNGAARDFGADDSESDDDIYDD